MGAPEFKWAVACWVYEHPILGAAAFLAVAAVPATYAAVALGSRMSPLFYFAFFGLVAAVNYLWVLLTIGRFARTLEGRSTSGH